MTHLMAGFCPLVDALLGVVNTGTITDAYQWEFVNTGTITDACQWEFVNTGHDL
ncbi:hypothetical protein SLEP1_g39486 [Rubroshorea leprosula]|uniref:Uncharacterized protein n=1 Tax=Rubroshorea leprosula TaxID=152421 RepID=A0AAV5L0D4_9ROSI|nr:hypothetical protein SLEP1_g39486 [Rubroshorea leprosula]